MTPEERIIALRKGIEILEGEEVVMAVAQGQLVYVGSLKVLATELVSCEAEILTKGDNNDN
jgi:hypothetical protein